MSKSPDAFRTISEVAEWLDTPAHVLRFWESKFSQIKPVKRAGGRRYYRPADMALLGGLKKLLHEEGMTIKGAQALLREKGVKHVAAMSAPVNVDEPVEIAASAIEVEAAPQEPREIRGLPPSGLQTEEAAQAPAREWDLIEDPEVVDMSDAEPAEPEMPTLSFIHREPEPDQEPPEEHFLSAAGRAVDDQAQDTPPQMAPPVPPPESAGPVRLDALRGALADPGQIDGATLAELRSRLRLVRDRLAENI